MVLDATTDGLGACPTTTPSDPSACWTTGSNPPAGCNATTAGICFNLLQGERFLDPVTGAYVQVSGVQGPGVPGASWRSFVGCVRINVIQYLNDEVGNYITPGSSLASINNVATTTSVPDAANDDDADADGELTAAYDASPGGSAEYLLRTYGAGNYSSSVIETEGDLLATAINYADHYCGK